MGGTCLDLWVENVGGRVRLLNLLSGLEANISPQSLASLAGPVTAPVVESFEGKPGLRLNNAISRFLRDVPSQRVPPGALDRLALSRSLCLAKLPPESEACRDLNAAFQTAEYFLRESPRREFEYWPGLLQAMWQRPVLEYRFGQLPCMPETTQRRVALARPVLREDSRGLILGDDDLMGLCWGLMYEQPCDVFELDQRLLDFYQAQDQDGLAFHKRDLTQGLPPEFHGLYDVIFTDPMYGRAGMDMFLACCSQGLSNRKEARLFLSTRPDLIEAGVELPRRLAEVGLELVKTRPGFSRYRFPETTRRLALESLLPTGFPRSFLRALLKVPYYYSDLLEVARIL